jgi:hypothetical protein
MIAAEAKLRGAEQAIDDVVVLANAVVDKLAIALRSDDEERRRLALARPRGISI